jgi:purine-cytosine permease-like protein
LRLKFKTLAPLREIKKQKIMNTIKKYIGLVWMILGPAVIFFLIAGAIHNIDTGGTKDINKPIPWIIIITVFTPIVIGLMIFGWYAFKNEYDHLPEKSAEIE